MAQWEQNPTWTKVANINQGKQYVNADGVTAADMNKIIQNMIYLKTHGNEINVDTSNAYVSGDTLYINLSEV